MQTKYRIVKRTQGDKEGFVIQEDDSSWSDDDQWWFDCYVYPDLSDNVHTVKAIYPTLELAKAYLEKFKSGYYEAKDEVVHEERYT